METSACLAEASTGAIGVPVGDERSLDELLRAADRAMYGAKRRR